MAENTEGSAQSRRLGFRRLLRPSLRAAAVMILAFMIWIIVVYYLMRCTWI